MSVDILKLKALAQAAKQDQYDYVALNDYGMAMPPAVTLELIAEIERHRQVNAEGCKPEISILPVGIPCASAAVEHGLDKAEGGTPDNSIMLSGMPCAGAAVGRGLNKAEGGTPDSNIHPSSTPTSKALCEAKAADNELLMAQVGLLAAVRRIYPTGSRLLIQASGNKIEIEVTGHCAAWWSRPGYIYGKNLKTNKPRTFHHSAVLEVLP
ncbi:MAG: hypothetical protein ACLGJA_11080 [Gammaproteobacteria bacterium]